MNGYHKVDNYLKNKYNILMKYTGKRNGLALADLAHRNQF